MDGKLLTNAPPLYCLRDFVWFNPSELQDGRNIIVRLVSGQVLVDPQCRGSVSGGTEGSHMDKTIVVQLSTKGLEITSVEILWQNLLRKCVRRKQDQQASAPFNDARMLFPDKHIVQSSHKFVQSHVGLIPLSLGDRRSCFGRTNFLAPPDLRR